MENEQEHLSQSERAQMKGALRAFIMEHPTRAPLSLRFLDAGASFFTGHTSTAARSRIAVAASLAIIFAGVGTSYAAESALPGDALYPIKINVNEKIAVALAPTQIARAQVVASHTIRRIQEAETLAAEDRLSTSTTAQIQSQLQDTTSDFDARVAIVAESPDGAAAAADLQSNLQLSLAAHARVLAVMQAKLPQTQQSLTPILATVVAHAQRARKAELAADSMIAASSTKVSAVIADKERTDAQNALSQVRALVADTKNSLGTTTAEKLARRALNTEQTLNAGQDHLDRGDTTRATTAFRAAIRAAAETKTDVDAAVNLRTILQNASTGSPNLDSGNAFSTSSGSTIQDAATSTDDSDLQIGL